MTRPAPAIVRRSPWNGAATWVADCCPRFAPHALGTWTDDGYEFMDESTAVVALAEHLRSEHGLPARHLVVVDLEQGSTAAPRSLHRLSQRTIRGRRDIFVPTVGA